MSYAPLQWLGWVAVMVFLVAVRPGGNDLAAILAFAAMMAVLAVSAWQYRADR